MAKQTKTYQYKVVIRYISNLDVFIVEDESMLWQSESSLRDNSGFISIGNKCFNKKDIIYIEELKGE